MSLTCDVGAATAAISRTAVQGVKLHVLGLEQIKKTLGPKWPRLSALVHKLMKKAITRTQGPFDHFVVLDELSYAVTFAELTPTQTDVICEAIAREVCELLFGEQVQEISLRTVSAPVSAAVICEAECEKELNKAIEDYGIEVVYRHVMPSTKIKKNETSPRDMPAADFLPRGKQQPVRMGLGIRLYPIWDLRKEVSNSLLLKSVRAGAGGPPAPAVNPGQQLAEEIDLLHAAEAYAVRLAQEGQICAMNSPVSYSTLGALNSRIRYLTALQGATFSPRTPLVLRIIDIPTGAPEGRLAELVSMLHSAGVRVALKFSLPLPDLDIRTGADGIGITSPESGRDNLLSIATTLADLAFHQRAFSFIGGLDSPAAMAMARQAQIRFGAGAALHAGALQLDGSLPQFPLSLQTLRAASA
jgi:hypothetical protein